MSLQSWHRTQAQNPDLEDYEIRYHQRQARFLADPSGDCDDTDVVGRLAEAAEALDDDDVRVLDDTGLAELFARVDVARDQIEAELARRCRRAKR